MEYSPIHRLLGHAAGPLTFHLVDAAVAAGLAETRDLDWKRSIPEAPGTSDFPKDVAAMANSGGGIIVYGVTESNKSATGRFDVGEVTETQERTLRAVAASRISPPVLNLRIERIQSDENSPRALAVTVPPSDTPPHLIFENQGFRGPARNDADTVWMSEPQLAAAYRSRFDGEQDAELELDRLYEWAGRHARTAERAWLVAVAQRSCALWIRQPNDCSSGPRDPPSGPSTAHGYGEEGSPCSIFSTWARRGQVCGAKSFGPSTVGPASARPG